MAKNGYQLKEQLKVDGLDLVFSILLFTPTKTVMIWTIWRHHVMKNAAVLTVSQNAQNQNLSICL